MEHQNYHALASVSMPSCIACNRNDNTKMTMSPTSSRCNFADVRSMPLFLSGAPSHIITPLVLCVDAWDNNGQSQMSDTDGCRDLLADFFLHGQMKTRNKSIVYCNHTMPGCNGNKCASKLNIYVRVCCSLHSGPSTYDVGCDMNRTSLGMVPCCCF